MVLYLSDSADLASGKFLTSETAPYVVSIIEKMLEWECGILLSDLGKITEIMDIFNNTDPDEQPVTAFLLRN